MNYREALRQSTQGSGCCAKAEERLQKYIKNSPGGVYVPCSKKAGAK